MERELKGKKMGERMNITDRIRKMVGVISASVMIVITVGVVYADGVGSYSHYTDESGLKKAFCITKSSFLDGVLNKPKILLLPDGTERSKVTGVHIDDRDGYTDIGVGAFSGCKKLKSVEIPGSVTSIGARAFYDCSQLTNITIPNSVTSIGIEAFSGCEALKDITIPANITNIASDAFSECRVTGTVKLTLVAGAGNDISSELQAAFGFGDRVTSDTSVVCESRELINKTFCKQKIKKVVLPEGCTSIGARAFFECKELESVEIPYSVTSIGNYAFSNCSELKSVTIPCSVESIGVRAFSGSGLKSITIPADIKNVEKNAFDGCPVMDTLKLTLADGGSCDISDKLEAALKDRIGTGAIIIDGSGRLIRSDKKFCGHEIRKVALPKGCTIIEDIAFSGCKELESVTIPCSVTSIGNGAFRGCSKLKSITIPANITDIKEDAFLGCPVMDTITLAVGDGCGVSDELEAALRNHITTDTSVVCESRELINKTFCKQKIKKVVLPEGCTSIGDYAFSNCCSGLESITIPYSVTSIGECAFNDCHELKNITILGSVTSIGKKAFYGCKKLESITIHNRVESIGDEAFEYCSKLKSITIPNGVNSIGERAFLSCSELESVEILDSVTSIGARAFSKCSKLKDIMIPSGVTSIETEAFKDCSELKSVTIPCSVESIGTGAFSGCKGLKSITIPADIKNVEKDAFFRCPVMDTLKLTLADGGSCDISDKLEAALKDSIGTGTSIIDGSGKLINKKFCEYAIREVVLPEGCPNIGEGAFSGSGLESITIPCSVTSIGNGAFKDCFKLKSITIPGSVKSIGKYAFYGCSGLESITIPANIADIAKDAFQKCQLMKVMELTGTGDYRLSDKLVAAFEGHTGPGTSVVSRNKTWKDKFFRGIKIGCIE